VVISRPADLDGVLEKLLTPPAATELEAWFEERESGALQRSFEGIEEQCQHWWANECPSFVAEACHHSQLVGDGDGSDRLFDGTLRVAFALIRRKTSPQTSSWYNDRGQYIGPGSSDASEAIEDFDVDWLGGYWKLPSMAATLGSGMVMMEEDLSPGGLHACLVSSFNSAEKRTAPVEEEHLRQVCGELTSAIQAVFRCGAMCIASIMSMYREDKLFCSFVLSRVAADMRSSGKNIRKAKGLFDMAKDLVMKTGSDYEPHAQAVLSYIHRNLSVTAMTANEWHSAVPVLWQSLERLPTNATSYYFLGMCMQKQLKLVDAIKYLHRSILLDPDFKLSYIVLGSCFLQLQQFHDAMQASTAGLRRHPDSLLMKYNMGQAIYHMMMAGENAEIEEGLQQQGREFLDCARRNVPDQWCQSDQHMLDCFDADADARRKLPKIPVHVWKVSGWRP
jgi:hypothetical protein